MADADRDALHRFQDGVKAAADAKDLDQERAPILEGLEAYYAVDVASFCIPAHKCGQGVHGETQDVLDLAPFRDDAPMHKGLDDRTGSKQVLTYAQDLAADAFGSDQCFFSTNGSTLSVELAVLATTRPGGKILVERNIHKSVISGLALGGAEAIWAVPELDERNAMSHCVTADTVRRSFADHPDIEAVLVVSPTYFGAAADVAGIASVCHEHGVPLVVDDAWGALFRFHPDLPQDPISAGADIVVSSFHKSITALMQCSIVNVQGDRFDLDRLKLCFDAMETTSVSTLLLASMDGARRQMALHGRELLDRTLGLRSEIEAEVASLPGLRILGDEIVDGVGVAGFDPTKLTLDLTDLGINGNEATDWLFETCRVGGELSDHRHLMFLLTVADDDGSAKRLVDGIRRLVDHAEGRPPLPPMAWAGQLLADADYAVPVRDAMLGPVRKVALGDTVGELAAEPISPYPPGVPVVVPGQRITQEVVDFLKMGLDEGMMIKGVVDPSLESVRVVA